MPRRPPPPQRARWSLSEDVLLRAAVTSHGASAWARVASAFAGARSARQCRDRFAVLSADRPWTPAEDAVVLAATEGQWAAAAEAMSAAAAAGPPRRTALEVRNRYHALKRQGAAGGRGSGASGGSGGAAAGAGVAGNDGGDEDDGDGRGDGRVGASAASASVAPPRRATPAPVPTRPASGATKRRRGGGGDGDGDPPTGAEPRPAAAATALLLPFDFPPPGSRVLVAVCGGEPDAAAGGEFIVAADGALERLAPAFATSEWGGEAGGGGVGGAALRPRVRRAAVQC